MGFYGKAFDNGLQAKATGSKPILFQPIRILGVPDYIVLKRACPCPRPFRSLTITLFTSLV